MALEAEFQIGIRGLVDHLRQRLGDLLLRVILQAVQQEIVKRFNVFCKNAHAILFVRENAMSAPMFLSSRI
jgi:hypothetical protein